MQTTKYFKKWATGKPSLLAIISHVFALHTSEAFALLNKIQNDEKFLAEFIQPDLDTWLKMFRTHQNGLDFLLNFFTDPTGFLCTFVDTPLPPTSHINNNSENQQQQVFQEYLDFHNSSQSEFDNANPADKIEASLQTPEFYFFVKVFFPCWLLHSTTPAQLLRKARLHDFDSLEKLVQLDSSIIFDRRIAQHIHHLRKTNPTRFAKIHNAARHGVTKKITIQNIKVSYAALITSLSIEFGHKLTEPEVRALFDAIAHDQGKGDIDTDLPDSPHAFYMAMKRTFPKIDIRR